MMGIGGHHIDAELGRLVNNTFCGIRGFTRIWNWERVQGAVSMRSRLCYL